MNIMVVVIKIVQMVIIQTVKNKYVYVCLIFHVKIVLQKIIQITYARLVILIMNIIQKRKKLMF